MTAFVTGGSGFVGGAVIRALVADAKAEAARIVEEAGRAQAEFEANRQRLAAALSAVAP